jgi:hypothetical protein
MMMTREREEEEEAALTRVFCFGRPVGADRE